MAQSTTAVPECIAHDCLRCKHDPRNGGRCVLDCINNRYRVGQTYCHHGSQFSLYINPAVVHSDPDSVDKRKRR